MLQPWRLKLREAELAYKADRLEEARDLLARDGLAEFLPAKRLMGKLARGFVQRGKRRAQGGESSAGWRDLQAALTLGADTDAVAGLRKLLVERALAEAECYLAAGEAGEALDRLQRIERRGSGNPQLRMLKQVATKAELAERLGREGRFAQAEATLATATALRPDFKRLGEMQKLYRQRQTQGRDIREQLHEAPGVRAMAAGRGPGGPVTPDRAGGRSRPRCAKPRLGRCGYGCKTAAGRRGGRPAPPR